MTRTLDCHEAIRYMLEESGQDVDEVSRRMGRPASYLRRTLDTTTDLKVDELARIALLCSDDEGHTKASTSPRRFSVCVTLDGSNVPIEPKGDVNVKTAAHGGGITTANAIWRMAGEQTARLRETSRSLGRSSNYLSAIIGRQSAPRCGDFALIAAALDSEVSLCESSTRYMRESGGWRVVAKLGPLAVSQKKLEARDVLGAICEHGGLSPAEASKRVGKSENYVANIMSDTRREVNARTLAGIAEACGCRLVLRPAGRAAACGNSIELNTRNDTAVSKFLRSQVMHRLTSTEFVDELASHGYSLSKSTIYSMLRRNSWPSARTLATLAGACGWELVVVDGSWSLLIEGHRKSDMFASGGVLERGPRLQGMASNNLMMTDCEGECQSGGKVPTAEETIAAVRSKVYVGEARGEGGNAPSHEAEKVGPLGDRRIPREATKGGERAKRPGASEIIGSAAASMATGRKAANQEVWMATGVRLRA